MNPLGAYKKLSRHTIILTIGTILALFLCLSPNPFGNITLPISDEEIFYWSALMAIGHGTIPGLDFSKNIAPYGAVLTNLIYLIMLPIYSFLSFAMGSSQLASIFTTAYGGYFLQIVRWINGLSMVLFLVFTGRYALKSKDPVLRETLWVLLALTAGNALLISMVHTGKVWALQSVFELTIGTLVFIRECLKKDVPPALERWYLPSLLWLTVLAASQTFLGALAGLWIVYAYYLGHFSIAEGLATLRRNALFIAAAIVLQMATLLEGLHTMRSLSAGLTHINNPGTDSVVQKFTWAFPSLLSNNPSAFILFVALGIMALIYRRNDKVVRIALLHPLLLYIIYFGILGISGNVRYIVPVTVAMSISILFLLTTAWERRVALGIALASATVVAFLITRIWWGVASEKILVNMLLFNSRYNNPNVTIYIEPIKLRFISRYLENKVIERPQDTPQLVRAKRKVALLNAFGGEGELLKSKLVLKKYDGKATTTAYEVVNECSKRCTPAELTKGTCVAINAHACEITDDFLDALGTQYGLLQVDMLGDEYFIRQVK